MEKKDIPKKLSNEPGVYFFKKKGSKKPLYIGKATNLRSRVHSYFNSNIVKQRGPLIKKMISSAETVEVTKTDSVLEALLLEAELIKKYKPLYNTNEKDDKSPNYITITNEEYPVVSLIRGRQLVLYDSSKYKKIFGPFPNNAELKEALKIIRKIFPWRDKNCNPNTGKPCFNKQIGLCSGVCTDEITQKDYNFLIKNLSTFLSGKKKDVIKNFEQKMKTLAKTEKFEGAQGLRNKIFALNHIHDVALIKRDIIKGSGIRIEGYDIAHLHGTSVVGAMVVLENGKLSKNEYRKFKIQSKKGIDDVGNLKEMLMRRFHHIEWPFPQIIVVDGGHAQVNVAQYVLAKFKLQLKIISVVKNEKHKPERFLGDCGLIRTHKNNIILINQEAHRFVIAYHRNKRNKSFLT